METIKDYPMYQIDQAGNVLSSYKHRLLKHHNNDGYLMVYLKNESGSHWQYIHRLLALQFIPLPDHLTIYTGELWVNHKDGNKSNNALSNLEWNTISENIQHSYNVLNREIKTGSDHWRYGAKLSTETKLLMSDRKKQSWRDGKYKNRRSKDYVK